MVCEENTLFLVLLFRVNTGSVTLVAVRIGLHRGEVHANTSIVTGIWNACFVFQVMLEPNRQPDGESIQFSFHNLKGWSTSPEIYQPFPELCMNGYDPNR